MNIQQEPQVNAWYRDPLGKMFQVVALDDYEKTVELQHVDGALEEMPLSVWYATSLEAIEPSEDWTGPIDDMTRDDLGDNGLATHPVDWNGPWDEIDREY